VLELARLILGVFCLQNYARSERWIEDNYKEHRLIVQFPRNESGTNVSFFTMQDRLRVGNNQILAYYLKRPWLTNIR
jgi:hypothetical protein